MRHIMLDLETFGTAPGSVLRSIGAVGFDPHGSGHEGEFYVNIDRGSCEAVGLTVDLATEKWWAEQSKEANDQLMRGPIPVLTAVKSFHAWYATVGGEYVWCQGANFDSVLWEQAAKACGARVPWKFWNVRDTRTIYHMARFNEKTMKRSGTYHNALDDAKHQVACVQEALKSWAGGALKAAVAPQQSDIEELLNG